jgi:hypothetical protein
MQLSIYQLRTLPASINIIDLVEIVHRCFELPQSAITNRQSAIPDDPDDGREAFDGLYAGEPAAFYAPAFSECNRDASRATEAVSHE